VSAARYFRLHAVDGMPLPVTLPYGSRECVVTDGDLVARDEREPPPALGDGFVCMRLIGSISGFPAPGGEVILLCRYPFDRLDRHHFTFPGGKRYPRHPGPEFVAAVGGGRLVLSTLPPPSDHRGVAATVGPHTWDFLVSPERLPGADE
jgi:hypothetical protein